MIHEGISLGTQMYGGDLTPWRKLPFQGPYFLVNSKVSLFGYISQMYIDLT